MNILSLLVTSPFEAVIFLVAIVIAITVHEYAHAVTAYRLGDDTPYHMGRVSLNPVVHLDPIGSIAFLLAGFGWGRPVVYNPMRLSRRVDELLVALAGPASNLILALILNILNVLLQQVGGDTFNPLPLQLAAMINVYLAAFNLVPIPPLDGSAIVAYFYPDYRSIAGGQLGLIILLLLIFMPAGSSNLLGTLLQPVVTFFSALTTLFGVLT